MSAWLCFLMFVPSVSGTVSSFAQLTAAAMCEAVTCQQNDSSCVEECVPTKLHLIVGREIKLIEDRSLKEKWIKDVELICHGTSEIVVEWCQDPTLIYIVEHTATLNNSELSEPITSKTHMCVLQLTNLQQGVEYLVQVRAVWSTGQVGANISRIFSTMSRDVHPAEVERVSVENVWPEDMQTAAVLLNWSSSTTLPCQYRIVVWNTSTSSLPSMFQINYPEVLNEMVLPGLQYDTNYQFGVSAVSEFDSTPSWIDYKTPSCLQFYSRNKSLCRPHTPMNVVVQEILSLSGLCKLVIHWDRPEATPEYYNLTLTEFSTTSRFHRSHTIHHICQMCLDIVVADLDRQANYVLYLTAGSAGAESESAKTTLTDICADQHIVPWMERQLVNDLMLSRLAIVLWISVSIFITMGSIYFCYYNQKRRKIMKINNIEPDQKLSTESEESVSSSKIEWSGDQFEIPNDNLLICDIIGEGAFGVVHKGVMGWPTKAPQVVAVKMLRDNPTVEERRQFQKEIDVMKNVGKHKNIVSLVGCCTQPHKLLLVVEFCPLGDLQNYLRQEWNKQTSMCDNKASTGGLKYADIINLHSNGSSVSQSSMGHDVTGIAINAMYDLYTSPRVEDKKSLASRLLSYSHQIALGMEYLSSNRVVHRDLAARNVLVFTDTSVKISDFGLSRDVYEQNVYHKKSCEKLPVKWMAFESLVHQIYTTQSDVWSFGILLWEIATLGGNPYPFTPNNQVFRLIKQGYRLEQPPGCSQEIYSIMMSCWREKPNERPTFRLLVGRLSQLLESTSPHQYLNLDKIETWEVYSNEFET